jgi:ditrans,polycis-polyprenyl diphosphate synthase
VCYKTGVKVVTIYAFSIENFKRSKHEVDALMAMAKLKLGQLSEHGALLDRYGASIRILGQRNYVKPDVLEAIDKAVALTAKNDKYALSAPVTLHSANGTHRAILNVCFPYTSRDEITGAVKKTVETYSQPIQSHTPPLKRPFSKTHITQHIRNQTLGEGYDDVSEQSTSRSTSPSSSKEEKSAHTSVTSTAFDLSEKDEPSARASGYLDPETITAETLTDNMLTSGAPPLDLLVRTSGVQRLSDFMLWQCHEKTSIVFLDCLWPEFDLWNFLPVLVEWQWQRKKMLESEKGRARSKLD